MIAPTLRRPISRAASASVRPGSMVSASGVISSLTVTSLMERAVAYAWRASRSGDAAQANVGVVLERLGDGAIGLAQRGLRRLGGLGERPAERADEEVVGVLVEREGARLAA